MNMQKLRTRRSLSGGVSCWKQKVRVTMTCCLINGLALVAEEQTHHSFQYQHATTLPKQYSSESCRTTQAQSNYDWLSHQRACHSNGGRNTFIIALRMNMQQLRTRRSLSGGVSCWKQKVRVTMTCCLINGLALVAEEQTHHSFQYQHATTLPKQYSSESCRTTQAQSNYDWLSHQRACHSNGGRNTFIIALRMKMQQLRTRRSLRGGMSCWKQKVRVTMTCCLINGLALVAEEQTHHSFQYQHATTLPKQYSSESCRTTQTQSNYDWLSHQRACHSNGGRNTFIMDFRINMQQVRTVGECHAGQQKACLSSRRTNNISAQLSVRCDVATNLFSKGVLLENRSLFVTFWHVAARSLFESSLRNTVAPRAVWLSLLATSSGPRTKGNDKTSTKH